MLTQSEIIKFDATRFNAFEDYWYNGKSYDDPQVIDLNKVNESANDARHNAILTLLYQSSSFKFNILLEAKKLYRSIHVIE